MVKGQMTNADNMWSSSLVLMWKNQKERNPRYHMKFKKTILKRIFSKNVHF